MLITREDIAALKAATSVTFHHYQGESFIRAHRDQWASDDRPVAYTMRQQVLYPSIADIKAHNRFRQVDTRANMYGYGPGESVDRWDKDTATAFYMAHHVTLELATIFGLMRAGDKLTLSWVYGNDNDNNREIGWHRDELRLRIARGEKVMVFLIEAHTGPDNSARMVRRFG